MTVNNFATPSAGAAQGQATFEIANRPHTVSGDNTALRRTPSTSQQSLAQGAGTTFPMPDDLAANSDAFSSNAPSSSSSSNLLFPPEFSTQSGSQRWFDKTRFWHSHNSEEEQARSREPAARFSRKRVFSSVKPLPNRFRRSSTPHDMGSSQQQQQQHQSNYSQPAPTSPNKRSNKQSVDSSRPKKVRSGFSLTFGDRKDTPAPGPSNASGVSRRPLSRNTFSGPVIHSGGGDGARRAAANSNGRFHSMSMHRPPIFENMPLDPPFEHRYPYERDPLLLGHCATLDDPLSLQEALQGSEDEEASNFLRRARLGSLNSAAADSGADLSTYSGSSTVDSKNDMEIDSVMADTESICCDGHSDFTNNILPDEISVEIFRYLEARDLKNVMTLNSKWHALATDRSVWRSTYLNKYDRQVFTDPAPIQVGGLGVGRPGRPNQQWEKMYKARMELDQNWRKGAKEAGKAIYLSGHTDSVYCLQFDEEKIITGSRDRTIRVWDINTFQCLRVIGGPNVRPVLGPKVLRTVDYPSFHMATASVNGTNYGNQIYHVPWTYHDASILCLQYDEKILVTGSSDSDLLIWDVKTFEPIKRLTRHTGGVLDVALDAKHIVSCSKDSRIIVWDRDTYEPKAILTGHRGPVNAVQLRGNFLVSASGDGIARLWDLTTMKLTKEFSAKERGLAAVEFSEDMKYVLAGGNDHITYKFETETGKEVAQFVGHSQLVRSLWLDSANKRVVSGSYDLDLRVYDFVTGQEIWRAEEWTTSWMLAAKSDYRRIVAASQDGRILLVDFGINRGGKDDGELIPNINLLRGIDKTNEVEWRPIPW